MTEKCRPFSNLEWSIKMIAKLTENQLTKDYQLIFKHNVPGTEPYRFSNVRVSHVFFFLNVISYNKFKFG